MSYRSDPEYNSRPNPQPESLPAMKLKVFTTNYDGRRLRMVATTSRKRAAKLIGTSLYDFRLHGGETTVEENCRVALAEPGVVFQREMLSDGPWERIEPAT